MTFRREETVWIPESDLDGMSVDTLAVRAGQIRTGQLEHSDAIFPTSSFVYGSAAQAAARFGISGFLDESDRFGRFRRGSRPLR